MKILNATRTNISPAQWAIPLFNMIRCFNRQATKVFDPMRNKFHLNRTQSSGSCLTENTVWIRYKKNYPVTFITRIYCEIHTVCKYIVWSKCKISNVNVGSTYIYNWDLKR